jgi:hypothetical protein
MDFAAPYGTTTHIPCTGASGLKMPEACLPTNFGNSPEPLYVVPLAAPGASCSVQETAVGCTGVTCVEPDGGTCSAQILIAL